MHILRPRLGLTEKEVLSESLYEQHQQQRRLAKAEKGALSTLPHIGSIDTASRRSFLKGLFATAALSGFAHPSAHASELAETYSHLPAIKSTRNTRYPLRGVLTPEHIAAQYNNFYEFSTDKKVWKLSQQLTTSPWVVKIDGLVHKPRTFDVETLLRRMPMEERIYRLRCVEAWSMAVPWTGFQLSALLKEVEPMSKAKYVEFRTFLRPEEAPGQRKKTLWLSANEPWPYTEALSLGEALSELSFMATGIYGHVLPKQHGAPIRLLTPWKYGFKSIKSVVSITLTEKKPATFWNTLAPHEYGFVSNVDPNVPHPRWSQAFERDIGTRKRIKTEYLNGYQEFVGGLYRRAKA